MKKFLLPAGYLPILAPTEVFKYYEELRSGQYSHTSPIAAGFEYFYMVDQSPQTVNQSPLNGKIFGVHGPWTNMDKSLALEDKILSALIASVQVARNRQESAQKTLAFAESVGAKFAVFHTIDLDPQEPEKFVHFLKKEAVRLELAIYLEADFKKRGLAPWYYQPSALYLKFRQPVVFDMATVDQNGENSLAEWHNLVRISQGRINSIVGHIHLNEYQVNLKKDQGVLRSAATAQLLKEISTPGYHGYFTFEVGPIQSRLDKIYAGIFLLASLTKLTSIFSVIQKLYARKSQNNLYQSVKFATDNLI